MMQLRWLSVGRFLRLQLIDGNKRTAFYAMAVFLELHAMPFSAPERSATEAMLNLAAGKWDEARFLAWLRNWVR